MRNAIIIFSALLTLTSAAQAAGLPGQASHNCNIPSSVDIDAAREDSQSRYLGIFDGKWDGVLPVTLLIHEVSDGKAYGYYAWKDYGPWDVSAGCRQVLGRVVDGQLIFRGDDTMTFMASGSRLSGVYIYKPGTSEEFVETATFSRRR